ncbi:MAG: hypothetical protein JWM24_843 [Solirubrobacterales bacterium]|nr:hypothetical protein [Solirubrobacterales bacterium]
MSGGNLLVLAVVQLALTALPGIASTLLAMRLGARSVPVLLGIGLAGSGATALLAFWAYYLAPSLGGVCAYAIFFGSVALAIWCRPVAAEQKRLLRALSVPFGLWALGALFLIFFGFLHGGTEVALQTGATRFASQPTQLASDNFIPSFFSDWVFAGHPGSPPIFEPGWHFSDRPPLQVAYVLAQRIFGWDTTTLHFQLLGVILQQLWIVGLWALLTAARVSNRTRSLTMIAAFLSDVTILNGFFVWPKLLAAAFALAALALVVAPGGSPLKARPWTTVLLGALVALAYLSHGSAVFALIPLAVVAIRRGMPHWRRLAAGAAAALVLILPWAAYQHYGDPPGNRVVKWALAGVTKIDDRGTLDEVVHAYREAGIGGALHNKLENFLTMAGGGPDTTVGPRAEWIHFGSAFTDTADAAEAVAEGRFGTAVSAIRESRFSHLLWSFGILILALPLIVIGRIRGKRREGEDWSFARLCLFVFGFGTLIWGLLLFGNPQARAIVIQDSLAMPIVAIAGLLAGLRATYPRWATWLVAANAVTVVLLYVPALEPTPGSSYSPFAAVAAAAALAGFAALAFSARSEADPSQPRGPFSATVAAPGNRRG